LKHHSKHGKQATPKRTVQKQKQNALKGGNLSRISNLH